MRKGFGLRTAATATDNQLELATMPGQRPRTRQCQKACPAQDLTGHTSQQSGGVCCGEGRDPKGRCGNRPVCRTSGVLVLQFLPLASAGEEGQLCPADWAMGERGWRKDGDRTEV